MKKLSYSEIVSQAHKKCGGKREIHFSDARELAGHLAEILFQDPQALKTFVALGGRRVKKGYKK